MKPLVLSVVSKIIQNQVFQLNYTHLSSPLKEMKGYLLVAVVANVLFGELALLLTLKTVNRPISFL